MMDACTNATCNEVVGSPNLYTGELEYTDYGYLVNGTATKIFLALFTSVTVLHILLAVFWRRWWTLFTLCLGGALEAIGWGGRLWSYLTTVWDPTEGGQWSSNDNGFIQQIVCLIIAPTFFSAANYIFLGTLVRVTGSKYSSITPESLSLLFTFADFLCLLVQCIGGGVVGTANDDKTMRSGLHIMAVGVIAQVLVTAVYCILFAEFVWRSATERPSRKPCNLVGWTSYLTRCLVRNRKTVDNSGTRADGLAQEKTLSSALSTPGVLDANTIDPYTIQNPSRRRVLVAQLSLLISTLLVMARSLFRCDELLDFTSSTSGAYANQNLFIAMDASLMLALLIVFLAFHPGLIDGKALLGRKDSW